MPSEGDTRAFEQARYGRLEKRYQVYRNGRWVFTSAPSGLDDPGGEEKKKKAPRRRKAPPTALPPDADNEEEKEIPEMKKGDADEWCDF